MITGRGLRGGQRDDRGSVHDLFQQRCGHRAAGPSQQSARDHDSVDVGFHHQRVAKRLRDDHDLGWPAADSADVLRQRCAQDAKFVGEPTPDLGLPTGSGLGGGAALLQVVSGRQELRQPVAQQFLFLAQVEVHLQPQCRFGENVSLNLVASRVN